MPHHAQIISILLSLGTGAFTKIKNIFLQVGTGEGKSLTLGITSSMFALLGFDISCACYSKYLSKRDY